MIINTPVIDQHNTHETKFVNVNSYRFSRWELLIRPRVDLSLPARLEVQPEHHSTIQQRGPD